MSDPASAEAVAPAPEGVVLSARGLTKRYRMGSETIDVLRGIDLDLMPGETVAIMGRSGAGKSTLLHMMGLLDRPDGGTLSLSGTATEKLSVGARCRLRNREVGFVFQFYHLIPELTALENALLPMKIRHGVWRWPTVRERSRRRAQELLEELELGGRLRHRPSQLSGGERQRVAIARALMLEPSLMLCDEPTGNLDERTADIIAEQLLSLTRKHGHTLVLVTHDAELAERADRTLVLHDGALEDH